MDFVAAVGVPRRASSAMACLVVIKRRLGNALGYPISDLWLTDCRDRSSCLAATGLQKANFLRHLHDLGRLKACRGVRDELYVPVDVSLADRSCCARRFGLQGNGWDAMRACRPWHVSVTAIGRARALLRVPVDGKRVSLRLVFSRSHQSSLSWIVHRACASCPLPSRR